MTQDTSTVEQARKLLAAELGSSWEDLKTALVKDAYYENDKVHVGPALRAIAAALAKPVASPDAGERLYDVRWRRQDAEGSDGETTECHSLTPRVFFSRLMRALRASGPIVIEGIAISPSDKKASPDADVEQVRVRRSIGCFAPWCGVEGRYCVDCASPDAGLADRAEQLMQAFYLSDAYDPHATRPADKVKAAILFALSSPRPVDEVREALTNAIHTLAHGRRLIEKCVPSHSFLPEHDRRISEIRQALASLEGIS